MTAEQPPLRWGPGGPRASRWKKYCNQNTISSREGLRGHFALYKWVIFFPATCIRQRGRTDGRHFLRPQKLKNKSPPDGRPSEKKLAPDSRPPGSPAGRLPGPPAGRTPKGTDKKKRKNQSVSQTIDQVMAINSVQKSSKSELSSRGKHLFKVFIYSLKLLAIGVRVRVALASLKLDRAENRFVKSRSR